MNALTAEVLNVDADANFPIIFWVTPLMCEGGFVVRSRSISRRLERFTSA